MGQNFPNVIANIGLVLATVGDIIPAGKYESVCLSATLGGGVVDSYVSVYLADAVVPAASGNVITEEPVLYRRPGGSPILLMNFILRPNQAIQMVVPAGMTQVTAVLFNRWRFDA